MDEILKQAAYCRAFEEVCRKKIDQGIVKVPTYLSAGQELIPSTLAKICHDRDLRPNIFAQHRCHSTYLSFGGFIPRLINSLLGKTPYGSASLSVNNMYGHDGMMGSNAPIAVGHCYSSRKPTIVFLGDAAAEEDYALSSYGWASTHNLPILFVVEDNGLSILTKTEVRRNWRIADVANAMKLEAYDIDDDPEDILNVSDNFFKKPMLINVATHRKYWHSGSGSDGEVPDRLLSLVDSSVIDNYILEIEAFWQQLEKQ